MQRIFIVGSGGAGKSTLAKKLSAKFDIQSYELDSFFWEDNWVVSPQNEFLSKVQNIVSQPDWIIDGNYRGPIFDSVYNSADTLIWLNLPKVVVAWRFIKRSLSMWTKGENFFGKNCPPSLYGSFKALGFVLATYDSRNKFLKQKVNEFEQKQKKVVVLNKQKAINEYIQKI